MFEFLEKLENRTMFSVNVGSFALQDGRNWLWISSDDSSHTIDITASGNPEVLPNGEKSNGSAIVKITGDGQAPQMFVNVAYVDVWTNGGNDSFRVHDSNTMQDVYVPISIWAGDGQDSLVVDRYNGVVHFWGGTGNDYANASNAIVKGMPTGTGTFFSLSGAEDNDVLIGSSQGDRLNGGAGNDIILGNAGDDEIYGESGTNILVGGAGSDMYMVLPSKGLDPSWDQFVGRDLIIGDRQDIITKVVDSRRSEKPIYNFFAFGVNKIKIDDLAISDRG